MTTLLAFDTKTIVETRINALRSRAITYTVCLTSAGILYVNNPADLRFTSTPHEPFGAVRAGDQWIPLTDGCIQAWAHNEHLHWRRPDGTIVLWNEVVCGNCDGTGTVISYQDGHPLACWLCHGTGKILE